MSNHEQNQHTDLLTELYRIDPDLRQYEVDLPNLITALTEHQPTVTINETFVHNLRASLLQKASVPTSQPAPARELPSPFIWWATRLAPVGVALVLLITLVPDPVVQPIPEQFVDESTPTPHDDSSITLDEMVPETIATEMYDDSMSRMASEPAMMAMKAPGNGLTVEPPIVGTTATITSVMLPEAGWLVVYSDDSGTDGEVLGTTYLTAGEYYEVAITLTRTLTYPEMITLVAYTGTNTEAFDPAKESIQIDPLNNTTMTVTVPVVSELELGLPQ